MEQLETMNSAGIPTDFGNHLEPQGCFTGFDTNDELVGIIEEKKKSVKKELLKEKGVPMEEDQLSDYLPINNIDATKIITPKSNVSPREINHKTNRSSNKKIKKDIIQNDSIDCTEETNFAHSLELTTPTFNLTSPTKTRRSIFGRKVNTNISNPLFKLPFEHGWKRELVYRTTGDSTPNNRTTRSGDVYYYSPLNRKLRSLREIQEQLDLSFDNNTLTIDSFTFLKQPIGINDTSKELIRDANTKLSKEESFAGTIVRPKKSKTPTEQSTEQPCDFELSDNENNKSSHKMKIVFKSVNKKRSRSKSKKDKSSSETMNTSSSTPEYIAEDWQAIQSSVQSKAASPSKSIESVKSNTTIKKRRSAEINGSLREISSQMTSMQSFNYMVKAVSHVFMHLKTHELLAASRVCSGWNIIAMQKSMWKTMRLKNSMVFDWDKCIDTVNDKGTNFLDTRRMLIPPKVEDFDSFWLSFAKEIKRAKQLKSIELYRCPIHVVEDVIYSLPQLVVLNASSIKNPHITKDIKNQNEIMTLNLSYLGQMNNLTELRLKGLSGIKLTMLPSFKNLVNLKTLSLTSFKVFPRDFFHNLDTVTSGLEHLEIGDCDVLSRDFAEALYQFTNLKSLRLENCCGRWDIYAHDIFVAIRSLEKLKILELINIDFSIYVEEELEQCDNIRALLIIPAYISQSATTNCHLIDCLKKLSKTLTHMIWGLTYELLRVTDLFITQYQENQHSIGYNIEISNTKETANNIPILRTRKPKGKGEEKATTEKEKDKSDNVDILSIPALEKLLETMMLNAKTKVIKVPYSTTTRVYLSEHFNDL